MTSVEPMPSRIRRDVEARKARSRLYPVSVVYTGFALTAMAFALRSRPSVALLSFLVGVVAWTLLEYLVHRYILHGRFPDGPGLLRHFCHKYFDHLHGEHHQRPWDGNHINGTISDTLPFLGPLVVLGFLAPIHTLPAFWAGVLQAYIVEEWVHHSVHFCHFKGLYFQYIKRHHLYHHSPKGAECAFGLTSGFWDIVYDTRITADVRRSLYAPLQASRPGG